LFALVPSGEATAVRWTRESDQTAVDIDVTPAGGPLNAFWIAPHDPLEPNTEYRISTAPDREYVLTTGQATDTTPPENVSGSIAIGAVLGACNDVRGTVLRLDHLSLPDSVDSMVLQIDVKGPDGVERLFARGTVGLPLEIPFGVSTSGDASCLGAQKLKNA